MALPRLPTLAKLSTRRTSESQLLPYVTAEKQKQQKKWNWLKPIEFVFDLLQRGQYTTANVVQELINKGSFGETVQAGWEGLMGKRKGTYKTTFFGGQDIGGPEVKGLYEGITGRPTPEAITKPLFQIPIIKADVSWADIIGFAGDVLLDPTTYVTFGATRGAKMAASQFAEKAVKQQLKTMAPELSKLAKKGFNASKLTGLLDESGDAALKYMQRYMGKNAMNRTMNKMLRDFRRKGLKMGPEQMQKALTEMSSEALEKQTAASAGFLAEQAPKKFAKKRGMEELMGVYRGVLTGETPIAKGMGRYAGRETARLKEAMASVTDFSQFATQAHIREAGMRAWTPFGFEAFKGRRQPNLISRSFETLRESFSKTKPGQLFEDAWWAVMNKGPVGALRKIFGFRNPYQQMLRAKEMRTIPRFGTTLQNKRMDYAEMMEGMSDEVKKTARDMIAKAEIAKADPNWIANPQTLKLLGVDEKMADDVATMMKRWKGGMDEFLKVEQELAKEGLIPEFGGLAAYLPDGVKSKEAILGRKQVTATGTATPGFTLKRDFPFAETQQQEVEKLRWLFGLDDESARLAVDKGWSTHYMNLDEMYMNRAIAHSQAVANAHMVREFKQFGIPITGPDIMGEFSKEAVIRNRQLLTGLERVGGNVEELGLFKSSSPLMVTSSGKPLYFDKDVRDIIDRVTSLTSTDEGLQKVNKLWRAFSTHWRSIATLTPGFHMRNLGSGLHLLWVKNGPAAFDLNSHLEAAVITLHALGNKKIIQQSGIPESTINEILARQIGNVSLKDIGNKLYERGLISRTTRGFDTESMIKAATTELTALQKINPVRLSREFGSAVESFPKVQSVLTDLKRMLHEGDTLSDEMVDFATDEAKKWWFDYADLTPFEQKGMKTVIPFYTWIRKNLALQMHVMGHYKHMMNVVPKTMRAVGADEIDLADIDEYIREEVFIPTEMEDEKVRGLTLDLPFKDINKIPLSFEIDDNGIPKPHWEWPELLRDIMGMAHPIIKTIVEVAPGGGMSPRDIFRDRDLGPTAIAPRALRYLAGNPKVLGFVDGLARRIGMENGLDIDQDAKGRLMIDSNLQRWLENNFIVLQRINQLEELGGSIFPRLTELIDEATGYKGGSTDTDRLFRSLSFALGIKPREVDLAQTEYWRYKDILRKAQGQRARERRQAPGHTARSQKYIQSSARRMRRVGL